MSTKCYTNLDTILVLLKQWQRVCAQINLSQTFRPKLTFKKIDCICHFAYQLEVERRTKSDSQPKLPRRLRGVKKLNFGLGTSVYRRVAQYRLVMGCRRRYRHTSLAHQKEEFQRTANNFLAPISTQPLSVGVCHRPVRLIDCRLLRRLRISQVRSFSAHFFLINDYVKSWNHCILNLSQVETNQVLVVYIPQSVMESKRKTEHQEEPQARSPLTIIRPRALTMTKAEIPQTELSVVLCIV